MLSQFILLENIPNLRTVTMRQHNFVVHGFNLRDLFRTFLNIFHLNFKCWVLLRLENRVTTNRDNNSFSHWDFPPSSV